MLAHGTKSEAETLKAEIGELLARRLKMTLSVEKTHITHIDDGFVFLGFHIQRRPWYDGRRVVLTIPSKPALASVMHKIKKLTGRSTTSLSLEQVLRSVNPVLRGWTAYFRYGASKRTLFSLVLRSYCWEAVRSRETACCRSSKARSSSRGPTRTAASTLSRATRIRA
ncbi:hypothetical protein OHT77_14840 [Streptomyces sp. NBC_00252]|uniref:group II intron maturase-specific domain-containing protein n=1 Tax=Streptomyces sp. NBC_00252 TaxID=2975691 RepID=UPI002E2948BE|nr:group II intron maturase-specific domain-containing protein [Streptomyces sp. NBC_00252]